MDLAQIAALAVVVSAPFAPVTPATGPAPHSPYAVAAHPTFGGGDWELVRRDGSRHPFTETPAVFMAYDDVVVNGFGTEGGFVVQLFDGAADLQHEQGELCHFALVTTPDRAVVAWLQNDGSLVEQYADGSLSTRPVRLPGGVCGDADPVALRGPKLYVDSPSTPPSVIAGPNPPGRLRLFTDLADVSGRGLLVGRLGADPRCSALVRPRHGVRWQTCTDRAVSFSPDGHRVLGSVGSVEPHGLVVHRVRDGRVVAQWQAGTWSRITQVEWEDAGHLLAVVRERGIGWSVVRLGLDDGSAEYAVAPVRTGAEFSPFRLQLS